MRTQAESPVEAQREVQRKLGRNLLRIQQLEVMAKAMVAHSVVECEPEDMHGFLNRRRQEVARKTLGQVVGDLASGVLTLPASEGDTSPEDPDDPTKIRVRTTFRVEMLPDDHQRMQQGLAELVELRNRLVHHFVEDHDIGTEAGCARAAGYLDDCFRLIDERFEELRRIAQSQEQARKEMASFMQSDQFMDFVIHGILPGGAGVVWPSATIVNLLRDAESKLAVDGWTPLERAISYIAEREPSHTPKRYGCSSWRQVLHESTTFQIRRDKSEPAVAKETWYRSR